MVRDVTVGCSSPRPRGARTDPTDHAALALDMIDDCGNDPRLIYEQRVALAQVHADLALVGVTRRLGALAGPLCR